MALPEAGVGFLDEPDLFLRQLEPRNGSVPFFQL
jgi:hypothetical protein